MNQKSLINKIALVIGGTALDGQSSIGAAICHFLKDAGATVLACSSQSEKVTNTLRALAMDEEFTEKLTVDVTDHTALKNMIDWVHSHFGRIDILVNAQGIGVKCATTAMNATDWQRIFDVNILSVALACQYTGAYMLKQKSGHIINITSATALQGFSELAAYGASKGGVHSLTQHLACEWARAGVCVNSLAPGWFLTEINRKTLASKEAAPRLQRIKDLTPAKRIGDDKFEDLRAAVMYLTTCSPYVNGQSIVVDGGFSTSGSD